MSFIHFITSASLVLCIVSCKSGLQIRARADIVKLNVDRARRSNAERCAPRVFARAEANLDFALGELKQGNSTRAHQHILIAEENAEKAVELSKPCAAKQVVLKKQQPQMVVKIKATDKDSDGVLDKDDKCPSLPGPAENQGCPLEAPKDSDVDGILDSTDQCPNTPEDIDNWMDEDGCPDVDNDGDGIIDTSDKCPNQAGTMQHSGCPVVDKDQDGINDDKDQCPDEPEDKDGFQDVDGCPDLDNDADGVPDDRDKCPLKPGLAESKGCPRKYTLVKISKDRIQIKKQIKFAPNSTKIIGRHSRRILDEVADALEANTQITKIRIEGHTDSRGRESTNLRLSEARASAVMIGLIRRGIDPARMQAVGYGEANPIASNATASGRAENRRTEFKIISQ